MSANSDDNGIGGIPSYVFHKLPDGVKLYIQEIEGKLDDLKKELKKVKEDQLVLLIGSALTGLASNPAVISDIDKVPVPGIAYKARRLAVSCLEEHARFL